MESKKQSLASWEMICKPKSSGGLGILDFEKQNQGLLMKHLHKFITMRICHGLIWYGDITLMKSHTLPIRVGTFGGETL